MIGIDQVSNDFVNDLKILACFDPANMSLGSSCAATCPTNSARQRHACINRGSSARKMVAI